MYSFLQKSSPKGSPKGSSSPNYSFLEKTEPKPRTGKLVNLPSHLGGGEYVVMDDGGLYTLPRSQDAIGPAKKGHERDHIIPVSLGGTSDIGNLQYLESKPSFLQKVKSFFTGKEPMVQQSPKRQEGKLKEEQRIINEYQSGKISLGEARTQIGIKQMDIKGLLPSDKASKYFFKSLGKTTGEAVAGLGKEMLGTVMGALDFVWRAGLQITSGAGALITPAVTHTAKLLGDKSLENISYDELWRLNLEQYEKRTLDIDRPDEYFRSRITGTEYREMNLLTDEAKKIGEKFHTRDNNWDKLIDVSKIVAIGFMREWANPFWAFSVRGVKNGSFNLDSKGKLLGSIEINPGKSGFLGKAKNIEYSFKVKTEPQNIVKATRRGVKKIKEPDLHINIKQEKTGKITVELRNKGGDIINKEVARELGNSKPVNLTNIKEESILAKPIKPVKPVKPVIVDEARQALTLEAKNFKSVDDFIKNATINDLNPTGGVFTNQTPEIRAVAPLGKNITTLDKTMKVPDKSITIYRGVPTTQNEIVAGDFVTTNKQLAKDYAGAGKVLSREVKLSELLDDVTEPLGEEYIYRPKADSINLSKIHKEAHVKPAESLSTHYERVKEQYGFTDGVKFTKQTELSQKKKAFDLIQRNPERAMRIGYGYEEIPRGVNEQIFRASLVASLMKDGKVAVAQDIAKIQSLKLTESAQSLAFAKTDLGKEANIIKNITQKRLQKIGASLGEVEVSKQVKAGQSRVKSKAKAKSKEVSKELSKELSKKEVLKEVDDLINKLLC